MRSRANAVQPSLISQPAPPPEQKERADLGIGRALRLARTRRGNSLEEASRDTRVSKERLEALEEERFDVLGGDVYVRSLLRSYAKYLDLDGAKVIRYFEGIYRTPPAPPAPVERAPGVGPTEAAELTGGNRRSSWLLAALIAGAVLVVGAAIGILSRSTSAPDPVEGVTAPSVPPPPATVEVGIAALHPVRIEVIVDEGDPIRELLQKGDVRAFDGEDSVKVRLSRGAVAELTVDGVELGTVGKLGRPFVRTYVLGEDPSHAPAGG